MTASNVLVTKDKVQRYLSELVTGLTIDNQGRFSFRQGSSRLFVSVEAFGKDDVNTAVTIEAPLAFKVPPSPELYRYIATTSWRFGHLIAVEGDEGVMVLYVHNLLGDYLDSEELLWAAGAMAHTADEVDTEIVSRFGGELFHEDD